MDKKKSLIALAVLLLGLLIGEVGPRLLIGSHLEAFEGDRQAFAAYAWTQARTFFSGSMEPLFWTAIWVQDVEEKTGQEGQPCLEATVWAYTLFGLPWSLALVSSCNGGAIVRQRWGLAPFVIGRP